MPTRRDALLGLAAAGSCLALPAPSRAQTWPSKPVRVVVPYPPGGSTDITARIFGQKLSQALGQNFVVDNRPGGGGNIGMDVAAHAPPDGHTLVVATTAHAINMTLFKNLSYDTLASFTPVALLTESPLLLVVHPSVPAKSVAELISLAKAKPGALNYASSGNGQSTHLGAELFATMAGIKLTHVPYRGSAPAIADVVAGQAQLMFDTTQSVLPHVEAGAVRALGVTTRTPLHTAVGEIPAISDAGLPGYEVISWNGFLAPKGTPDEIVAKLNREVMRALDEPDVKERFAQLRAALRPTTPAEFESYIRNEIAKWAKVVAASGAKVD